MLKSSLLPQKGQGKTLYSTFIVSFQYFEKSFYLPFQDKTFSRVASEPNF